VQEDKQKPNTRGNNIKYRLTNYHSCFIERRNAVQLCKELETLHAKTMMEMDSKALEDLEFDRLMGRAPESTASSSMQDEDLFLYQQVPHISKAEESKLLEQQYTKHESKVIQDFLNFSDVFKSHCLKMTVADNRNIHERLQPPQV